jgi:hypothetical protein
MKTPHLPSRQVKEMLASKHENVENPSAEKKQPKD